MNNHWIITFALSFLFLLLNQFDPSINSEAASEVKSNDRGKSHPESSTSDELIIVQHFEQGGGRELVELFNSDQNLNTEDPSVSYPYSIPETKLTNEKSNHGPGHPESGSSEEIMENNSDNTTKSNSSRISTVSPLSYGNH